MKLVFGTGGRFGRFNKINAEKLIQKSLELGINTFDTGYTYGNYKSQILLSKCLEKTLKKNRDEIVLSTKCSPKSADYIEYCVTKSIETLQCKYLNYFHLWGASVEDLERKDLFNKIKDLLKKGKVKVFSVTTQDLRTIKRVTSGNFDEIKGIMIDYNLLKQNRKQYVYESKKNNIVVFGGTTLCQGFLIDSLLKITFRTKSPFYFGRAILKKETRSYLKPSRELRIHMKNKYRAFYQKIPLSFVVNEKMIDFIPIGMLSKESIEKNVEISKNPIRRDITDKVAKWALENYQANDIT